MTHQNGGFTNTILKARLGDDVRRTSLHHSNDLTLIDLLLNIQRIFHISTGNNIILKYKDSDGDLITLAGDDDLLLALHTETSKTGILDVSVILETKAHQLVQEVQQQVDKIKNDVSQLLNSLSSLDDISSLIENCSIGGNQNENLNHEILHQKNIVSPPSPIPSERPEIPATIQPSVQEQVLHDAQHGLIEQEISLENSFQQQGVLPTEDILNTSSTTIHDQYQNQQFSSPPSIPSFPTSNSGPPPQEFIHQNPPIAQFTQQPPQSVTSHSSVASTPVPHGHQSNDQFNQIQQHQQAQQQHQQPPQSNFSAPPQFEQPPQSQQQFNGGQFHAPPLIQQSNQQGFAPPNHSGPGGFAPPPNQSSQGGFAPSPQPGQGFAPPPQNGPQQGFAPPPQVGQGFAPPPPLGSTGMAPPPHQPAFAPPSQGGFGGFAPPPQNVPGSANLPPQGPPSFGPPGSAPQGFSAPPTGFAPPLNTAGNPFARGPGGPGYRQSPYQ